jgi:ABC-2 type transport system ATP-binding protein
MSFMITAENVCKSYGAQQVLFNLNLKVATGSIFGLLGPNGAGKTTFVKCLLSLVHFNVGSIFIDGIQAASPNSREGIGFLPEKFHFYPYYTVKGAVEFFARMHGHPKTELNGLVETAIKTVGLTGLEKRRLGTLSKGQLQRVGLSNLLVSNKKILILDEPFSGLDPIALKELKELIKQLNKEKGVTFFINSHILSEVQGLCSDIAVLNNGICLAQGNLKQLIGSASLEEYFYRLIKGQPHHTPVEEQNAPILDHGQSEEAPKVQPDDHGTSYDEYKRPDGGNE